MHSSPRALHARSWLLTDCRIVRDVVGSCLAAFLLDVASTRLWCRGWREEADVGGMLRMRFRGDCRGVCSTARRSSVCVRALAYCVGVDSLPIPPLRVFLPWFVVCMVSVCSWEMGDGVVGNCRNIGFCAHAGSVVEEGLSCLLSILAPGEWDCLISSVANYQCAGVACSARDKAFGRGKLRTVRVWMECSLQ